MRHIGMVVIVMLLNGCGGGGSGGQGAGNVPPPPQGAPPPPDTLFAQYAVSLGTYPGCPKSLDSVETGSLFVLAPCIDAATLVTLDGLALVDGQPLDLTRIRDGTVVTVRGSHTVTNDAAGQHETSVATAIDIQRTVLGMVESVDPAHARLHVLGQQIYVSDITRIADGGTIGSFAVGDRVLISGFFSPNGEVFATAISRDIGTGFVVRGILHIVDAGTFKIGQLVVGCGFDCGFDVRFPGGAPSEGDPVVVFGDSPPSGNVLNAEELLYIGGEWTAGKSGVRSFEATISSRPSLSQMGVQGRSVDCGFFDCEAAREAQVGSLVVVVQGDFLGDRNPTSVLEPASANISIVGPVDALDVQNGSLSVLGFPVQVLPATVLADETRQPHPFADVALDTVVTASGGPVGDLLVAGRITTYTNGNEPATAKISTRIASYTDPDIHVLGRKITTDPTTSVAEDCVGDKDLPWLFDAAARGLINQLRMEVSGPATGEIVATHIEVDDGACSPWDY